VTDPETLARRRFRSVRRLLERRDKIGNLLAEARRRSGELHAELPQAEQRDREARGRATAEGRSKPQLEAPQIASELEDVQQRVEDLQAAATVVEQDLQTLRRDKRDPWSERQAGRVEQAKRAVFTAAGELEQAVSTLEDENALRAWITEPVGQGSVDPAGGRVTYAGAIAAALDQVRAAVDGIAAGEAAPTPAPPQGRKLLPIERPGWGR
jgi:hypothetical protein